MAGTASVRAGPFGWLGARSRPPAGRIGFNASTGGRRANGPEQLCTLRAEPSVRAGARPYAVSSKFVRDEHGCDLIGNPCRSA